MGGAADRTNTIAQLEQAARSAGSFVDRAIVREIKIAANRHSENDPAWFEVAGLDSDSASCAPAVRIHPIHRASRAILGRAAQTQKPKTPKASAHRDLRPADYFTTAQTEPALVRILPGSKLIEPLEELEFFSRFEAADFHGATFAGRKVSTNRRTTRLRSQLFSEFANQIADGVLILR